MNIKVLIEMYRAFSPSKKEYKINEIVRRELDELKLEYNIDDNLQIYNIKENTPLLCAHMDQVSKKPVTKILIDKKNQIIKGDGNIGADDKNGIWIILQLLKEFNASFIFSTCEEVGGNIHLLAPKIDFKEIKYGLIFDRKDSGDIIGDINNYCIPEFNKDIADIGKKFGYKSTVGAFSDCDFLSKYISCVNLSCGFYLPHKEEEYTKLKELFNSLNFGREILKQIDKKYDKPEPIIYNHNDYFHRNYTDDYYDHYPYNQQYNTKVLPSYDDRRKNIDNTDTYYYCDNCYHWFPAKTITIIMNIKCPICRFNLKMISRKPKVDNNTFYFCERCEAIFTKEMAKELKNICSNCTTILTEIIQEGPC